VYRRNGTAWTEEARLSPPRSDKADGEKADVHYLGVSVSSKGTLIAVSDYQYGDEDEGAVFVYKFDSLTKSWTPVGGPLVNPDCDLHFGSIVSLTQEDALFVTCGWTDGDSGSFYYYEPPGTGEDYVLRQSFALDDAIASLAVDGNSLVVGEHWRGQTHVIRFFVRRHKAWEEVATLEEPAFDVFFGQHVAMALNRTLVASYKNVYMVPDYFNSTSPSF